MTVSSIRRVATRMSTIGTEGAFAVSARARALEAQGRPMIHLQIGEPDFDTPAHVRDAAKRALDDGATH
jgi:aspartate/methionine/tyrosine aminotransferase